MSDGLIKAALECTPVSLVTGAAELKLMALSWQQAQLGFRSCECYSAPTQQQWAPHRLITVCGSGPLLAPLRLPSPFPSTMLGASWHMCLVLGYNS
mmetsp:Transcript_11907/g.27776  ORF Transcript_11907/g.27776 Transcript_11907/m.27776 type:complete len:96 (+) Transcript_11907:1334-1621(+)